MTNHYTMITMTTGVSVRSGVSISFPPQIIFTRKKKQVIGSIFRKSLRLSARARVEHSVGQIATMISTDASRLDQFSVYAHNVWVGPIQVRKPFGTVSRCELTDFLSYVDCDWDRAADRQSGILSLGRPRCESPYSSPFIPLDDWC